MEMIKFFAQTIAIDIPRVSADVIFKNGLNIFYFIVGVVAVLMIIVSGLMMSVAGSDPSTVARAKNMIMYAVIGLVVVTFAFAITQFIIGSFAK